MVVQCMRTVLVAVEHSLIDSFLPSLPLTLALPPFAMYFPDFNGRDASERKKRVRDGQQGGGGGGGGGERERVSE